MIINKFLITVCALLVFSAAASDRNNYIEIKFNAGSAKLTDTAKASINSIIKPVLEQEKKIDSVYVLSWSDAEYPSKKLKKLPKTQSSLAEKRNKTIENYVKKIKDVEVRSYNMAERPSAFSKLFNTSDTKLKDSLVSAGLSTTAESSGYVSKASRSIIVIKTIDPIY